MIATAIVCLTVLILAERFRPLLVRLVDVKAPPIEEPTPLPPLPADLAARVDACKEGWERSDLLGAIQEHYFEARALVDTDDEAWVAVRRRLRAANERSRYPPRYLKAADRGLSRVRLYRPKYPTPMRLAHREHEGATHRAHRRAARSSPGPPTERLMTAPPAELNGGLYDPAQYEARTR
jgi:hypothetical protein